MIRKKGKGSSQLIGSVHIPKMRIDEIIERLDEYDKLIKVI
jgi:hypothetical protein